ncbi:MAG: tetratricopeptide repeat protein [Phycisphaerae bacterium]|nr:tetratricopeptide repeat protein [Phycisphaerae bacterium]
MARRRRKAKKLNTRVALIGAGALFLLAAVVVVALIQFRGDPLAAIAEADAAVASGNYELAQRQYRRGLRVKDRAVQIDVLFRLADVYAHMDLWPQVRGSWEAVLLRDPENMKAALTLIQSFYVRANTQTRVGWQVSDVWREIESRSGKLMDVAERLQVADQDKAPWEIEAYADPVTRTLKGYLYFVRGRSAYEQARIGAVPAPEQSLTQALDDLKVVVQAAPADVEATWYLSQTLLEQARLKAEKGDHPGRDDLMAQAKAWLDQAVTQADNNELSHLNRLRFTLESYQRANEEPSPAELKEIESQYQALAARFSSSGEVFSSMSRFYWMCCFYLGPDHSDDNLHKAIEAAEKSVALAENHVEYAVTLAQLYYRAVHMFGMTGSVDKSVAMAEKALTFPDAQASSGPRSWAGKANRLNIYTFLATVSTDQLLEGRDVLTDAEAGQWLVKAENAVREIGQVVGAGDDPDVVKWQAILDVVKGHKARGARILYGLNEKAKGSRKRSQRDPHLAYVLSQLYRGTPEVGLRLSLISTTLEAGYGFTKPQVILDYLDLLGEMDMWPHVISAVNPFGVDAYEKRFGRNDRTRMLRVKALIRTNQLTEAQNQIMQLSADSETALVLKQDLFKAEVKRLRSSLNQQRAINESALKLDGHTSEASQTSASMMQQDLEDAFHQLLTVAQQAAATHPEALDEEVVTLLTEQLIETGRADQARPLVDQYLKGRPNSGLVLFYRQWLTQADPKAMTEDLRAQMAEQALLNISDPLQRSLETGLLLMRQDREEQAIEAFNTVLKEAKRLKVTPVWGADMYENPVVTATGMALDLLKNKADWVQARKVVDLARTLNVDLCGGALYEAQLAFAQNQLNEAMAKIEACLEIRPALSRAIMLRSLILSQRGKIQEAIEEIARATSVNPQDALIAKVHAQLLTRRNADMGMSVTPVQKGEAERALERAVRLNPMDSAVLMLYADQISDDEPLKAVAIYQSMQKSMPSLTNTVALGNRATSLARQQTDSIRRQTLFDIARTAFELAFSMAPTDRSMLYGFAQYYRAVGQEDKAESLLTQAQDDTLLWRHFVAQGRMAEARRVLTSLYEQSPKDKDVLKGLLLVAEIANDRDALARYFRELVAVDGSLENRFDQVAVCLKTGMISEAQAGLVELKKLASGQPRVSLLEGWLALSQGQLQEAQTKINAALDQDNQDALSWYLKGRIHTARGEYQDAVMAFRRSVSIKPDLATQLALAQAYTQAGRSSDAIRELETIVARPNAPMAAMTLLEQTYRVAGSTRQLGRFYKTMIESSPNPVIWCIRAGDFELTQAHYDLAVQWLGQGLELKRKQYAGRIPDRGTQDQQYLEVLDRYLDALVQAGQSQRTRLNEVLQQGLLYTDSAFAPQAWSRIAQARLGLGDRARAVEASRESIERSGTNTDLVVEMFDRMRTLLGDQSVTDLAQTFIQQGQRVLAGYLGKYVVTQASQRFDEAFDAINYALALASQLASEQVTLTARRARLYTAAYEATTRKTYLEKAISDYQSLLDKMPNNIGILNNLAYLMAVNDLALPEALTFAKRAVALSPDSPMLMDTYAFVLHKNRENERALELLSAATQQFQYSGLAMPFEVYEHMGMVHEALGQKDKALGAYEQALQMGDQTLPEAAEKRINSAIGRLSD